MSNLPIGIPTGEPANEEQWNAGYLAGFDDGKLAAMAERARLRAALDTELATERSALDHDRELRDALTADRDRLRDALIACRGSVKSDLANWSRIELRSGTLLAADEANRLQALLDTIDAAAAAKGQG